MFRFLFPSTASIEKLPLTNTPEVFGLHSNAEIGYYTIAVREAWTYLIDLQPQTSKFSAVYVFGIVSMCIVYAYA